MTQLSAPAASRLAGASLLVMAVLAAASAAFGHTPLAVGALGIVAVLDLVAAWALYVALRPRNGNLALICAVLRAAYAAALAAILVPLAAQPRSAAAWEKFQDRWVLTLVVFGLHLIAAAALVWGAGAVRRVIATLLASAGACYVLDAITMLAGSAGLREVVAVALMVTGILGEVLFAIWLLAAPRQAARDGRQRSARLGLQRAV